MSVVVFRGGGRGRGRGLADNNIGVDTNEIDDCDLIDQVRQQNKGFKLPDTTRLMSIQQLAHPKIINNEDDRFLELERKIDKIAETFSVFSVFAQWSGNLTVITSKIFYVVFFSIIHSFLF